MGHRITTGCMFLYEGSQLITIDAVDQYHPIIGLGEDGCIQGTTFLASSTGAITDTADNGGVLRCTDVAHGLTTGHYILLTGMGDAAHVGATQVTVIDDDTFDCDDIAYNSIDDTGNWARGASVTVEPNHGGIFLAAFSISFTSAGVNKTFRFEFLKNTTNVDTITSEQLSSSISDKISVGACGVVEMTGGDTLQLLVRGVTDDTNITVVHANTFLYRL